MNEIDSLFGISRSSSVGKEQEEEEASTPREQLPPPSQDMLATLFQNNDDLCLAGQSESDQKMRAALLHSEEYGIRDSVKAQVEDVRWLKEVTKQLEGGADQLDATSSSLSPSSSRGQEDLMGRCAVCTLPLGTCQHSASWLSSSLTAHTHATEDALQQELDQVLGLLEGGGGGGVAQMTTKHQHGDIDLDSIRWSLHTPRSADKIGTQLSWGRKDIS